MKLALLALLFALPAAAAPGPPTPARRIPEPLPGHPGNVFMQGEQVAVQGGAGSDWRLFNYEGDLLASGKGGTNEISLGVLPVGYYEIEYGEGGRRSSLAVLERLSFPTPLDSPISCDVALAWLLPQEKARSAANLCALAGLNWVRDRLNWGELETARGKWAASNRYDFSARAQCDEGLQVLQVNHISPAWANPKNQRFPLDLRDAFNFYREAARRWKGTIAAFEPWNEADIKMFGGHTGSEMASLQKAAYLGLKAGNRDVIACLNVFALHRPATLDDLNENEAWGCFDTYNLHHYEGFSKYPRIYGDHRAVSAGKPMWVSECSLPVKWQEEKSKEPNADNLKVQSERVAITYALSLFEGAKNVFYFVLPHYVEGQTQFGLIRPNLTPRPAYVALAAAGRLLAGAVPEGRLSSDNPKLHAYAFTARPGLKRPGGSDPTALVLVAWSDEKSELVLPADALGAFDHLGRVMKASGKTFELGSAPVFLVLERKTALGLTRPPSPPRAAQGSPAEIVLQALVPEEGVDLEKSAYKVSATQQSTVQLFAYNFGTQAYRGKLDVQASSGWNATVESQLEVGAGERKPITLLARAPGAGDGKIRIEGDFGKGGKPVLSLRFSAGQ